MGVSFIFVWQCKNGWHSRPAVKCWGERLLRINYLPGPGLKELSEFDVVDESMTATLNALVEAAYHAANARHSSVLRAFLT